MKIVVIADSHGNLTNLRHVLGFAQKIGIEAVIHCGDWDNFKAVETVLSFKIPLYSVLGNADIDVWIREKLRAKSQKFAEKFLEFKIDGRKIGIVHHFRYQKLNIGQLNILFFGHYHQQGEFEKDGVKIVNPGALEKEINFAIYDTKTDGVEFINEQI